MCNFGMSFYCIGTIKFGPVCQVGYLVRVQMRGEFGQQLNLKCNNIILILSVFCINLHLIRLPNLEKYDTGNFLGQNSNCKPSVYCSALSSLTSTHTSEATQVGEN